MENHMFKIRTAFIGLLILSLTATVSIASPDGGDRLLIYYSNDVRGELEPCG